MRNTTNQTGGRAEFRRRHRTVTSINHGLPVGFTTMTLRRHLFVERMIKQHNFPVHFLARQRFQLLKVAHADRIGVDSLRRSGNASSQSAKHNLLCRPCGLAGELRQLCCFDATYPMRHHHFFQLHVAAERFHFVGHVFDCLRRLNGTG